MQTISLSSSLPPLICFQYFPQLHLFLLFNYLGIASQGYQGKQVTSWFSLQPRTCGRKYFALKARVIGKPVISDFILFSVALHCANIIEGKMYLLSVQRQMNQEKRLSVALICVAHKHLSTVHSAVMHEEGCVCLIIYFFNKCSASPLLFLVSRNSGCATWSSKSSVSSNRHLSRRSSSASERTLRIRKLGSRRSGPSRVRWNRNVSAMANWVSSLTLNSRLDAC